MPLYTPFMADVGKMLGASERQRTEAELAGGAYMGDPQAMESLMRINPQMGAQIQQQQTQKEQTELQRESQMVAQRRKVFTENRELMDSIFRDASKIEDYSEAQEFVQRRFEENQEILGDMSDATGYTPEVHAQFQDIYEGIEEDPVQRSVDIPGEGTKMVHKSGKITFEPASMESRQAHIRSQEAEVEQAVSKAEKVEAAKLSAKSKQQFRDKVTDAAMSAREQMPQLENMQRLAKLASTGTFAEQRVALKRAFGVDVANEEEFMSESNRIILDAAESLKGALSQQENLYLEAVAPDIGKSRPGNLRIIGNLIAIANNSIDRGKALSKYKGDPIDFSFEGKPLFQEPERPEGAKDISQMTDAELQAILKAE